MSRTLAALLHVAIALGGGLAAAIAAPRDITVWLQLAVITAGAIVTYVAPLVGVKWQAWLKIALGAALPAAIAAALPFIPGIGQGFDTQNVLPLIIAVLVAVGTQIGVDARVGAIDAGTAVPGGVPVVVTSLAPPPVTPSFDPATTGGD